MVFLSPWSNGSERWATEPNNSGGRGVGGAFCSTIMSPVTYIWKVRYYYHPPADNLVIFLQVFCCLAFPCTVLPYNTGCVLGQTTGGTRQESGAAHCRQLLCGHKCESCAPYRRSSSSRYCRYNDDIYIIRDEEPRQRLQRPLRTRLP